MYANIENTTRAPGSTGGDAEAESTLVRLLLALMVACLVLVLGTEDARHRVVEPEGEVIEAEVIRRSD